MRAFSTKRPEKLYFAWLGHYVNDLSLTGEGMGKRPTGMKLERILLDRLNGDFARAGLR